MKIAAYCSFAGAKVLGPGSTANAVTLHIRPVDNDGLFTKTNAAAALSLNDVSAAVLAQFTPGQTYTLTIEETPVTVT